MTGKVVGGGDRARTDVEGEINMGGEGHDRYSS